MDETNREVPYHIRSFRSNDRQAVIQLWDQVLSDGSAHNRSADSIDRKLAVDGELLLVAVGEGQLLGTAMGGYDGHRGWIYSVAVEPSKRRIGIGSALIRCLESLLAERGCVKVNLQVRTDNLSVVAFYEQLGFEVEQRVSMGKRL